MKKEILKGYIEGFLQLPELPGKVDELERRMDKLEFRVNKCEEEIKEIRKEIRELRSNYEHEQCSENVNINVIGSERSCIAKEIGTSLLH